MDKRNESNNRSNCGLKGNNKIKYSRSVGRREDFAIQVIIPAVSPKELADIKKRYGAPADYNEKISLIRYHGS